MVHVCHVPSSVNDLWSQIYAPLRTRQHTMATKNEEVTKAIETFYWDYSETVFLGLLTIYVPILYLPTFFESNAWDFHLVMTKIPGNVLATSEDFQRISQDFRMFPKILKCLQMFPKTFEHFRSYRKDDTFSVLWYDFVRTQRICLDFWVRRKKLSLMREIDVFSPQA